ncbi:hypothetical protein AB1I62_04020 [Enterococcus sp. AN402]|uniref:hypothetical protein n=1 Tax=Enterococcus sp. AN402 TaxID=3151386 RepID=UPI003457E34E
MKQIIAFIKKNKKVALIGLFFLIIFIGFSITNAINVADNRAKTDTKTSTQTGQTKEPEMEDISFTDKQKDIIKNYDKKTKDLIKTLAVSPWVSQGNKNVITFHNNYYEETTNGNTTKVPFAISVTETSSNGADTLIDTIVFETTDKVHLVTFSQTKAKSEKEKGVSTLSSASLFDQVNTVYTRVEKLTNVTITGLNKEATSFLGDTKELTTKLSEWCASHYPTMTTAVWNKSMNLSFNEKTMTATTAFFLGTSVNEATKSQAPLVTVIFDKKTKNYTFKM